MAINVEWHIDRKQSSLRMEDFPILHAGFIEQKNKSSNCAKPKKLLKNQNNRPLHATRAKEMVHECIKLLFCF
jgi:hypothetical protein